MRGFSATLAAVGDRLRAARRIDPLAAVSRALAEERARGRDLLLVAPALGLGCALHLGSASNPPASVVWGAFALAGLALLVFRHRAHALVWILLFAVSLGAAAADLAVRRMDQPRITAAMGQRAIEGRIVRLEDREGRSDRVTIAVTAIEGLAPEARPARLVVTGHGFGAFRVGDGVRLRARLGPNPPPTHPGAYDPAFVRYFDGVGGTGVLVGRPAALDLPPMAGTERWLVGLERLRMDWTRRIRDAIPGQAGPVAASLVTGDRAGISADTNAAYNASGLLHVLSISGLHVALVTGAAFFLVRGGLALVPALALRLPVKKIAAVAALLLATGYILISGMAVAAVRAYIMAAIVLVAILVERPAFTLRNVMLAGVAILLLGPDQIAGPSFQMSFAATAAIIAGVERGVFPRFSSPEASLPERALRGFATVVAANLVMSVLAEIALLPIALHHFHRIAWYGALGNLLSFLLVDFVIMPAVLATLIALPLGLEGFVLPILGWGCEELNGIARWIGGQEEAVTFTPGFGMGAMVAAAAALAIATIARTWLGLLAIPLYLAAVWQGAHEPLPLLRADAAGTSFALRMADGRLGTVGEARGRFAIGRWLEADGDARGARDRTLPLESCDPLGCATRLPDGRVLALTRRVEALAEDCARADVLVATFPVRIACARPRLVVDRDTLAAAHGLAIHDGATRPKLDTVAGRCRDRPWCPVPPARAPGPRAGGGSPPDQ